MELLSQKKFSFDEEINALHERIAFLDSQKRDKISQLSWSSLPNGMFSYLLIILGRILLSMAVVYFPAVLTKSYSSVVQAVVCSVSIGVAVGLWLFEKGKEKQSVKVALAIGLVCLGLLFVVHIINSDIMNTVQKFTTCTLYFTFPVVASLLVLGFLLLADLGLYINKLHKSKEISCLYDKQIQKIENLIVLKKKWKEEEKLAQH